MSRMNASSLIKTLPVAGLLMGGVTALVWPPIPEATAATAQESWSLGRIAAVVNDEVITFHDLEMRLRLTLLSSGLEDSPEVRQSLGPRLLRELIDEKLQLQEARRLGIAVSEQDIDTGISRIEQGNRMPPGTLSRILDSRGIDPATLRQQVRAEIAWSKAVRTRLSSNVVVTPQEVRARLEELKENQGQPEHLLAEIFLPFSDAAGEAEARQLAEHMMVRLRDGLSFGALARQFSASPTAAAGGDMGWVPESSLEPEVAETIARLQPGQMTLWREEDGLRLLLVRDRRVVGEEGLPSEEELRQRLEQQRMELAARKLLRNLRRSAAVDIRQ